MSKSKKFSGPKIVKAGSVLRTIWAMDQLHTPIVCEFSREEWQALETIVGYDPSTEHIDHNREAKKTHLNTLSTTDCPTLEAYDYRRGVMSLNPFLDSSPDRLALINHGHRFRVISEKFRLPENADKTVIVKVELTDSVAEGYDGNQAAWKPKDSAIAMGIDPSAATTIQECANMLHNRCQGLSIKGSGRSASKYCGRNLLQNEVLKLFDVETVHNTVWNYLFSVKSSTGRTLQNILYGDEDSAGFIGGNQLLKTLQVSQKEIQSWNKIRLDLLLLTLIDYNNDYFDDAKIVEAFDALETKLVKVTGLWHAWLTSSKRDTDDCYKAWVKLWGHILSDSWPTKGLLPVSSYPTGLADIVESYRDTIEEQLTELDAK